MGLGMEIWDNGGQFVSTLRIRRDSNARSRSSAWAMSSRPPGAVVLSP
jgi:hypothetical protein